MTETATDIVQEIFGSAGIEPGSNLIVHSSFREISRREIRAEAFIEALLDYVAGGTLLMPAMSWRIVNRENPVFHELDTPSHVGVLAEVFRTRYATHRSVHPTHSAAAIGPHALEMTEKHHLFTTPCPPESPFGMLGEIDATILLLGVGMDRCTSIHCVEEMIAPDFYIKPEIEAYDGIDRKGNRLDLRIRRHKRLDRDFPKFEPLMKARGKLVAGKVAGTSWRTMRARDLDEELTAILTDCPHGTLSDEALRSDGLT